MGWMEYIARTGSMRNVIKLYSENLKGRDSLGCVCVAGRIIIKLNLKK
jgi:hypothetical protein